MRLQQLLPSASFGMRQDVSRTQMRNGSVWNLVDGIPNLEAPVRERGGWAYHSADIAATTATAAYVIGGLWAPFAAGAKNLALDEDGRLYSIASDGTVTDIGAAVTVSQNPFFHRDKAIIPAAGGATAPKYYDGSVLGNLAGSPPNGIYGCVYKDYSVLANTSVNPNRLFFSDPGTPTSWDTTNSYWDVSYPVSGVFPLRNAIIAFSDGHAELLRGSVPPPGGDFQLDAFLEVGCTDARSIAGYGDKVIFANPGGIWMTDGVAPLDLTEVGGMTSYWQELLASYSKSTWTLAGGVFRNYYVVVVMDGSTFKDCLVCDLSRRIWIRFSNLKARAFWSAREAAEELYFGLRSAARVGKFSPVFSPSATYKNDGDGTAVTMTLETGFFDDPPGLKSFGQAYPAYDLRDAATDNPTMTVSYITSPEATSYTACSPTFSETTAIKRPRTPVRQTQKQGVAFKVSRTNASSDFRLYGLEVEVQQQERHGVN